MGGNDLAEELMLELGKRFEETGKPEHIKWMHSSGNGDKVSRGLNHVAHEGMLDEIIGGHFIPAPKVQDLIKTIANQGTTVLLVEQNVKQALKFSKRAYVLENGSIAMEDVSENLISNPHVQKAYLGL